MKIFQAKVSMELVNEMWEHRHHMIPALDDMKLQIWLFKNNDYREGNITCCQFDEEQEFLIAQVPFKNNGGQEALDYMDKINEPLSFSIADEGYNNDDFARALVTLKLKICQTK